MSEESSRPGPDTKITRRVFVGSVASLGLCPLLSACEFAEVFDTDVDGEVEFDLSEPGYGDLAEVGGMASIAVGALELLLVRIDEDSVSAYERVCPHQNLDMGSSPAPFGPALNFEDGHLTCPFHQSVFAFDDGRVLNGPSPRGLQVFPVDFDPASGLGKVTVGAGGGDE